MTKREKYKIALEKCLDFVPNVGDKVLLPKYKNTLEYCELGYFELTRGTSRFRKTLFLDGTSDLNSVASFFIALDMDHINERPDTPEDRFSRLMFDLETLEKLPDDTAASYFKGQITDAIDRYSFGGGAR